MKNYISAPLPFQGQKRRFVKEFRKALHCFDKATIFVDLFGGSGLLSHIAKRERPDARVIFNDYDDYHVRLLNIDKTNKLIADIRKIVSSIPIDQKLPQQIREAILERVATDEKEGFVDYITLSGSILFTMDYVTNFSELCKAPLYNKVKKSDYICNGYLDGLEIVKSDYKALFERFRDRKGVVFFVDPPYLSTDVGTYKNYWKLADYLDVLTILQQCSYIYFTSNKSSIVELIEWISEAKINENPFEGAIKRELEIKIGTQGKYTDIMLFRQ